MANRQLGLITWEQLIGAGVAPSTLHRWVKAGLLHRLHPRVYVLGHLTLAPMAKQVAAQLACGPRAVISHRSAAYLWRLIDHEPEVVDVTLAGCGCRPKRGIRLHRSTRLARRDVRLKGPLRLTCPARTVIDMAADAGDRELERVIAQARIEGLLRDGELERELERAGHRAGTRRLRALLRAEGEPGITRSEAERIVRRLVRQARLEQPRSNIKIGPWEVDFVWPEQRVIVEFDSYRFHRHRAAFERDRRKDMALTSAGYVVIRITWRQLRDEPFAVIAHIARALDRATRAAG